MEDFFHKHQLGRLCLATDDNMYIAALRRGLSVSIPFFLFGSFALVLINLPFPAYQTFIHNLWNGAMIDVFMCMFYATMGVLALVLIVSVSSSFGRLADPAHSGFYSLTCLSSYLIFIIEPDGSFLPTIFDSNWLFTAIIITLLCCSLLRALLRLSQRWQDKHYQEGIDPDFQSVMVSLFPIATCLIFFVVMKLLVTQILGSVNIQNIGSALFTSLFKKVGTGVLGSFLFIFLIHILWFFGIHGSNMLNMVSMDMFEMGMNTNMAAVAAGGEPTVLFTKSFFDSFILMGGSGATLCLLLAMAFGTKRGHNKSLFECSLIPSIFNINELVLFGLPVVFNPIMLIPFLLVPLVLLTSSALFMSIGLVPVCSQQVAWTTPIILSGYQATGSWAGALLQIFNLFLGAAIYRPFIKLSETYYSELLKKNANDLRDTIMEREESGNTSSLRSPAYQKLHEVIKLLTADLHHALNNRRISLYYQPQFSADGKLYGVEALLRWKHPSLGFLYPPMVIELARDDNVLQDMGYQIIETSAYALERLSQELAYPIDMAVNISPVQLEDPKFCDRVGEMLSRHDFHGCTMCFEITEQIALASTNVIQQRISRLHDMGILFHMDDFGMGHSSMTYLQNNDFSAVKLDGSLVKDMMANPRTMEIISGIQKMSEALNYDLIAEFVENTEERDTLDKLGCHVYQGYLYSPALDLPELEKFLFVEKVITSINPEKPTDKELFL